MLIKKNALLSISLNRGQSSDIDRRKISTRIFLEIVPLNVRSCYRFRKSLCQSNNVRNITVVERIKQCISIQDDNWIGPEGRTLIIKRTLRGCISTQLDSQFYAFLLRPFTPVVSGNKDILNISQAIRMFLFLSRHIMSMKILVTSPIKIG